MQYFLITDPARGLSIRLKVRDDQFPDEVLLAWARKRAPDVVSDYEEQTDGVVAADRDYFSAENDAFRLHYQEATNETVQLVEEAGSSWDDAVEVDVPGNLPTSPGATP